MKKLIPMLLVLPLAACAQNGQPFDAAKFFSGLVQQETAASDPLLDAAKNAEKQDNFSLAAQMYQQYLDQHPDNKDISLALADSYRRSGQLDSAITLYDLLIAKDAGNIAAKEGKGLALITKGDFENPALLFDDVMKADPTRWKTLNALGILFATHMMYPEAGQYFQEALKFSPYNPTVINNLGLAQALEQNYPLSIQNLLLGSGLSPIGSTQRTRIDLNLALVYAASGHLDEARAVTQNYYSGEDLNNYVDLYTHLAKDEQLAKTYLSLALTESKTFYEKAWQRLQAISHAGDAIGPDQKMSTPPGGKLPPATAEKAATVKAKKSAAPKIEKSATPKVITPGGSTVMSPAAPVAPVMAAPEPVSAAPKAVVKTIEKTAPALAPSADTAKKPTQAAAAKPKKGKDDELSNIINADN